eukprot:gene3240-6411_t
MSDYEDGSDDGEMDEFEESVDEREHKTQNDKTFANKPYDEAYEVSQDLSLAESFDGRQQHGGGREQHLRNDKYDEAVEVSQSMDQTASFVPKQQGRKLEQVEAPSGRQSSMSRGPSTQGELAKSTNISNRPFDEALEFSHDDESSVDTRSSDKRGGKKAPTDSKGGKLKGVESKPTAITPTAQAPARGGQAQSAQPLGPGHQSSKPQNVPAMQQSQQKQQKTASRTDDNEDDDEEDEDEESSSESGAEQESYDNIEGAYNPKDYAHLSVTPEIRDLFQYIERYKPHEVELETTLKCFIPEYIPAIGEMDAFIKVPRPDNKNDELGLKILDEPASNQSDPTVLELQLRATTKKQQYGDVAVKSIDTADKGNTAIDKWIQSISDLHRSKPPPQVHYKNNMPEFDKLMDIWPEEFEAALEKIRLPSPDLDISLLEYSKLLCSIVDIPMYENPVESLHHFFSLYMAFRDNPHFQARRQEGSLDDRGLGNYGGADVMQITQGLK